MSKNISDCDTIERSRRGRCSRRAYEKQCMKLECCIQSKKLITTREEPKKRMRKEGEDQWKL